MIDLQEKHPKNHFDASSPTAQLGLASFHPFAFAPATCESCHYHDADSLPEPSDLSQVRATIYLAQ